jgi:hypothetical protein
VKGNAKKEEKKWSFEDEFITALSNISGKVSRKVE